MPSGPTRLIYNTRERLLSTDHNRAQAFLAQAQQAAWRAQYNDLRSNWRLYPGLSSQAQTLAAPLYGEVYAGLFVRPDVPEYLTIDPGVAMMITDSAGVDDSPYAYVSDPGVQTPGVLTFTPNVTFGTLRWDVIECQPVDTVLESSNRDIYNPATGLFAPVNVDKVRANRLTYRIRLGTPSAGFPGAAAGWLPLATCAVRDGALGFHQCDFYDVRPLVSERVLPQPIGVNGTEGFARPGETHYQTFLGSYSGYAEAEFGGYLAGGKLQTSVPAQSLAAFGDSVLTSGGDYSTINIANTSNRGAYVLATKIPVYVAALFPQPPAGQGFIPRWARYSEAPVASLGRRVPNGPRGILTVTTAAPLANGLYAPTALPPAAQMNVQGIGVPLAMATIFDSPDYGYSLQVGRSFSHVRATGIGFIDLGWGFSADSLSTDLAIWFLTPGVHFPAHARAIEVTFLLTVSSVGTVSGLKVHSNSNGFSFDVKEIPTAFPTGPLVSASAQQSVIVLKRPTLPGYPSDPYIDWSLRIKAYGGTVTFNSASVQIRGWEM